jgi:uncharacterized OB-fold protein
VSESGPVRLALCNRCGLASFPRRLTCHRCGGSAFKSASATEGVVEESTTVRRRVGSEGAPAVLATVRLTAGPRVIAGMGRALPPGTRVVVSQQGGAIRADA